MFSGYLGLSLLAISFVSIGLFTSSANQNQNHRGDQLLRRRVLLFGHSWPAQAGGTHISGLLHIFRCLIISRRW